MTDEEAPPCMEVQGAPGHQVAIRFRVVTEDNIENLKALNTVLFPIVYSVRSYRRAVTSVVGGLQAACSCQPSFLARLHPGDTDTVR